jgi:signal peptidase I
MFGARRGKRYALYRDRDRKRKLPRLLRLFFWLFVAHVIVTTFLIQGFLIESSSMEPTFHPGDRVFATSIGHGPRVPLLGVPTPVFRQPERGDLVVVESPLAGAPGFFARTFDPLVRFVTANRRSVETIGVPQWSNPYVIRRVVALPGDSIEIVDSIARITPPEAHQPVIETSLSSRRYSLATPLLSRDVDGNVPFFGRMNTISLGPDEYFVMGDNRGVVLDSRHTGPVVRGRIVGHVVFRFWPLRRFGVPST